MTDFEEHQSILDELRELQGAVVEAGESVCKALAGREQKTSKREPVEGVIRIDILEQATGDAYATNVAFHEGDMLLIHGRRIWPPVEVDTEAHDAKTTTALESHELLMQHVKAMLTDDLDTGRESMKRMTEYYLNHGGAIYPNGGEGK